MQSIIIYNSYHLAHKLLLKPHPERPERVTSILEYLKQQSEYRKNIFSYQELVKSEGEVQDEQIEKITEENIIKIHGKKYFDFVQGMWCEGISKPEMFINIDTYYMKDTFKAAIQAAKTSFFMVEKGLKQKKNIFCLIRPPGHHSGLKNQPHGFSFFNNVALAANYFVQKIKKNVVIIDWDIHHGEGTQKIFYQRNDVLYISLHRFDEGKFFPHIKQSGVQYNGEKSGKGFNINIAWNFPRKEKEEKRNQNQTVRDQQYLYCMKSIIIPILKQYSHEAIFISCGFDGACGDPIGESRITQKGFRLMTSMLASLGKQIFIVLEGGYNIQCLQKSTQAVLKGLDYKFQEKDIDIHYQELNKFAQSDIQKSLQYISKYWKLN